MGTAKPVSIFILAIGLFAAFPMPSAAAFKFFNPADTSQVPDSISASGFYDNMATKQITSAAVPFEVNSPLWSDAAAKKRWVLLKPGTKIRFKDTSDYYEYPDGAVFVKQFAIDTVPGDTTSRVLWETRFLVLKKNLVDTVDKWYGFSYRWNRQGTNAYLVDTLTGARGAIRYYPNGRNQPAQMKKWNFPNQTQCNDCHVTKKSEGIQGRGVLGFFTAQLNRPNATGGGNQLTSLFGAGVFETLSPMPDFSKSPRWYGLKDAVPGATAAAALDVKARSYLAANCSGCHGDRGVKNNALGHSCRVNFDFFDMKKPEELGTKRLGHLEWQSTVKGNPATYDSNFIVYPKKTEFSSIVWRLEAKNYYAPVADSTQWFVDSAFDVNGEMMPPLGRYESDTAATSVIKAWINTLETPRPVSIAFQHGIGGPGAMPRVAGGQLILEGMGNLPGRAWLVDIRGARLALPAIGPGRYRLPARTAPGVYSLMLNEGRSYRIILP